MGTFESTSPNTIVTSSACMHPQGVDFGFWGLESRGLGFGVSGFELGFRSVCVSACRVSAVVQVDVDDLKSKSLKPKS